MRSDTEGQTRGWAIVGRTSSTFFRGSEFSRLVILLAVLVGGIWAFWQYGRARPIPVVPPAVAGPPPKPVEPDRSVEFESVTDRTPMTLRDTAAYSLLIDRARGKSAVQLAAESRRDLFLTHFWERPEHYRGVPVHIDGTALRVLRYESKLSRTGWLYEAWIETPETGRYPYVCVFEDPPKGFPIGPNLSERVVFNGYFLKIMKYQAGDVARGAPLLIGRIGWDASQSAFAKAPGSGSTLKWTLILLAIMFVVTLTRWLATMRRSFRRGERAGPRFSPTDEIDADALDHWVRSTADERQDGPSAIPETSDLGVVAGIPAAEASGAQRPDEGESLTRPNSGDDST